MARKQTEIDHPDIKRKRLEELEEQAALYRKTVLQRMELGRYEVEEKAKLQALVAKYVEQGKLKIPEGTADGEVVTVYVFDDEDEKLELKYGRKQQVRVRKVKAKAGQDETELME